MANPLLTNVETCLGGLGYQATAYGFGVALLSLESGYSAAETASHLALATLAQDAKDTGQDISKLMPLAAHARAMLDVLGEFKNAALMRDELFRNDANAMIKVVVPDKDQSAWIAKVLTGLVAKDRVAVSRLDYAGSRT